MNSDTWSELFWRAPSDTRAIVSADWVRRPLSPGAVSGEWLVAVQAAPGRGTYEQEGLMMEFLLWLYSFAIALIAGEVLALIIHRSDP